MQPSATAAHNRWQERQNENDKDALRHKHAARKANARETAANNPVPLHKAAWRDVKDGPFEPVPAHTCGPMDIECASCGALHFEGERTSRANSAFHICCNNGIVRNVKMEEPNKRIVELLQNKSTMSQEFLENIRFYNNALAFGSISTDIQLPGTYHHHI